MKSSKSWLLLAVLAIAGLSTYYFVSNKQQSDNLKSIRNYWSSYINTKQTSYIYSALGGVQSFDIPVENNTDYLVDEVIVAIKYIKTSGGTYKTENVTISNIPPHAVKTGRAPQSTRGTSVKTEITEVISRGLHLCYPNGSGTGDDPYVCR